MTHFTEGCLPRTGIRSGTVRSVIEYGHLYLYFVYTRVRLSAYNLERSSDAVDKELPAVLLGVVHPGRLHLRPHRADHVLDLVVWKQVRDLAGRQQVVDEDQEPLVGHLSDHTQRMKKRPTATEAAWSVCLSLDASRSLMRTRKRSSADTCMHDHADRTDDSCQPSHVCDKLLTTYARQVSAIAN